MGLRGVEDDKDFLGHHRLLRLVLLDKSSYAAYSLPLTKCHQAIMQGYQCAICV